VGTVMNVSCLLLHIRLKITRLSSPECYVPDSFSVDKHAIEYILSEFLSLDAFILITKMKS
jgi:hypothetical protein